MAGEEDDDDDEHYDVLQGAPGTYFLNILRKLKVYNDTDDNGGDDENPSRN